LLTYYLRDEAEAGAKIVLTITDSTGRRVRQIDGSSKAGVHRTAWDLREAPAQGQGGRGATPAPPTPPAEGGDETAPPRQGGGRGSFARSDPLVKPGSYQVTLGRVAGGTITPIGRPQTVEVVALEDSNFFQTSES
jgi:hypothetical protein